MSDCIILAMLFFPLLLLLLCGDIHPNPGPNINKSLGLSLCHINARSLGKPGRIDDIYEELCVLHEFDIIGVSETHLGPSIPDYKVDLLNYNLTRLDRNRAGGGVALYVRNTINMKKRDDLKQPNIEMLWNELTFKNYKVLVGVCYRPPNSSANEIDSFITALENVFNTIVGHNKTILVLLGDFNDRCKNWVDDHSSSELGVKLVTLLNNFNLFQLINKPTRNENLITDSPGFFTDVDTLEPISGLDHNIIYGSLSILYPKGARINRKIWLYAQANFELFNNLLLTTDWDNFFTVYNDVNVACENFTEMLLLFATQCIPQKSIWVRPRDKPGMTPAIRKLFRECKRLHKKAKRTGRAEHTDQFKTKRREAKSCFRLSRSEFYDNVVNKLIDVNTCNKTYWKFIKLVYGCKQLSLVPDIEAFGHIISDSEEKAVLFNNYFAEQCQLDSSGDDTLPIFSYLTDSRLNSLIINPGEVLKILQGLNPSKAVGYDNINNRILKECSLSLNVPLSLLFNLSLSKGVFPTCWKKANVVPVFKKGDRHNITNYRPVSLLSCLSKVFEKVVHTQKGESFIN